MELPLRRKIILVALGTVLILMVPLVAMQFSDEVDWGGGDFLIMGTLVFGTGLAYLLISRMSDSVAYRAAVAIAVVAGLLLVWVNLAVGIIGEPGGVNLIYFGVLQIGIIGAAIARLKPLGLSWALYCTAFVQALVPVIVLVIDRPALDEPPGIVGSFILNGFFVVMFVVSASLFRQSDDSMRGGMK